MRIAVRDKKLYMIVLALETICETGKYDNIYLRRWGNKNHVKAYKLGFLLKREDPILYRELFKYFKCREDDYYCLGKSMWATLVVRLKSLNIDIDKIETIGDLCNEVPKLTPTLYAF